MALFAQVNPWTGIPIDQHLVMLAPMLMLVVTMLAIVLCPIVFGRGPRPVAAVAILGVVVALFMATQVGLHMHHGGWEVLSTAPGAGMLVVDGVSIAFQVILLLCILGVTWLWWVGPGQSERNAPEFFILLLGSAVGMALMASTANLLMIVVAIEMASLPSYAFVGFDKKSRLGAEASLKYMVFGAISAAIMLYGVSLLYGLVGSLSVTALAEYTAASFAPSQPTPILLCVSLLCLLAGMAFKISAVPFHFWCPDAFQGARTDVTAWLSVASKAAGLVLLTRTAVLFCDAVSHTTMMYTIMPLAWVIAIIATVTCTFGNFAAYRQRSVKRMLAYSSIAHAGYMMMAAAVFIHPEVYPTAGRAVASAEYAVGMSALLYYVVVYMFMNIGAFGVTALVEWERGTDDIDAFTGLWRKSIWLTVPMVVCLVSLVGLPPLAGFLGKWWLLAALGTLATGGSSAATLGWFLIAVLVLNTLFSLYYYMRIVKAMALNDDGRPVMQPPVGGVALVNLCAMALLLLFVFVPPVKRAVDERAAEIYQVVGTAPAPATQERLAGPANATDHAITAGEVAWTPAAAGRGEPAAHRDSATNSTGR